MFSPRDSVAVLDEVGDKFLGALVRAMGAASRDYQEFRTWRPEWVAGMFEREVAGIIHTRLWAHLGSELDGVENVTLHAAEPNREISIVTPLGRLYRLRAKRHSDRDRISSYPTASDQRFWGEPVAAFEEMDAICLAVGYRWDAEARAIGDAVVSYREGKNRVVWAYVVEQGAAGNAATPIVRSPIEPTLPMIDLLTATEDESEEGEAAR